jgi:deazaflavin-dependent oxidoreductase (nitroreductase family)
VSDWNTKIIEEFRANGGAVGGQFAGAPLLLLHTVGARSGQRRVNPVMYQKVDGGYAVFASKAGAPVNPDWYHNLLAHPQVTAEIGTETVALVARVAGGDERERIWAAQKAAYPGFADYERKTTRQIPVMVLEPARLRSWRASAVRAERLPAAPRGGSDPASSAGCCRRRHRRCPAIPRLVHARDPLLMLPSPDPAAGRRAGRRARRVR